MHERLAGWVIGRPLLILGTVGLAIAAAAFLLTGFRIDGDFASLIPKDDPTLRLTRHLQGNALPSRLLLVVLRGESPDLLEESIPGLVERLRRSPFLSDVAATREELGGPGAAWIRRAPLYALPDEAIDRLQALLAGPDRLPALRTGLRRMKDDLLAGKAIFMSDPLGVRWIFDEAGARASARFSDRLRPGTPYLIVENPPVAFIRATGKEESFDIPTSYSLLADVRERIAGLPAGVDVRLAGGYVSAISHESSMRNDLKNTILLSIFMILAFLTWFTRSFVSPFFLLVPVALSILCALSLGGKILGPLTPLAVSVAAILVAQGIDYTIHYFSRFRALRAGAERDDAIVQAQGSLGRPFLGAALTTMAAFLILLLSAFPGLRQFGFLLFLGTLLCLVSSLTFFPVLLLGANRFLRPGAASPPLAIRLAHSLMRSRAALPVAAAVGLLGIGSWVAVGMGQIPVDLNVRNTMAPGDPGLEVIAGLEKDLGTSLYPVYALVDADRPPDEVRRAVEDLKRQGTVRAGMGLHSILPSPEKKKRVERFRRETEGWIEGTLADLARLKVKAEPFRAGLAQLQARLSAPAPTEEELKAPEFEALERMLFYREGNRTQRVLMLIPPAPLWHPPDREKFDRTVRERLGQETPFYSAFHLPIHYAGILKTDLTRIAGLTVGAICVLAILVIGSIRDGLLALIPVLVATGVTMTGCALLGGALNMLNMAAIPVILGIGVDDGIHFMARFRERGRSDPEGAILDVGPGVWGSTVTTLLGFGSIAFCATPGLRSMGLLVAVGATVAFVTTVLLLPSLLRLSRK